MPSRDRKGIEHIISGFSLTEMRNKKQSYKLSKSDKN